MNRETPSRLIGKVPMAVFRQDQEYIRQLHQSPVSLVAQMDRSANSPWDRSSGSAGFRLLNHGVDTPDDTVYISKTNSNPDENFALLAVNKKFAPHIKGVELKVRLKATSATPTFQFGLAGYFGADLGWWFDYNVKAADTWEAYKDFLSVSLTENDLDTALAIRLVAVGNSADTVTISEVEISLIGTEVY